MVGGRVDLAIKGKYTIIVIMYVLPQQKKVETNPLILSHIRYPKKKSINENNYMKSWMMEQYVYYYYYYDTVFFCQL
jgi:hypothetical protein